MAPGFFSFLGALTGIWSASVKGPRKVALNKGPMQTRGPYRKRTVHIKGLYRQGALTNKEILQTKGPYRQFRPL